MNQAALPNLTNLSPLVSIPHPESDSDICKYIRYFPSEEYRLRVLAFDSNEILLRFTPGTAVLYKAEKGDRTSVPSVKSPHQQQDAATFSEWAEKVFESEDEEEKSSCKVNDKADREGWGKLPKGRQFKRSNKRKIQRLISCLETKFGKSNILFATLTLPGSTEQSKKILAAYSSYVVDRITRYLYGKIGSDAGYKIWVWEFQKRGALHGHFVVGSNNKKGLKAIEETFKDFCYKMFIELGEKAGVDMFGKTNGKTWKNNPEVLRCNIEPIRKSASAYMSKYMSKNISKVWQEGNNNNLYYPVKWATWGDRIGRELKRRTRTFNNKRISWEESVELLDHCHDLYKKYGNEKYQKPFIYKDKIGYGVNVKILAKPEFIDKYFNEITKLAGEELATKRVNLGSNLPSKKALNIAKQLIIYFDAYSVLMEEYDIHENKTPSLKRWIQQAKDNVESCMSALRKELAEKGLRVKNGLHKIFVDWKILPNFAEVLDYNKTNTLCWEAT